MLKRHETSALSRIEPGLLAKIEPLPCTSIAGEAARQGCKVTCSVGFCARCRAALNSRNCLQDDELLQLNRKRSEFPPRSGECPMVSARSKRTPVAWV
jgi:hypothetical protein